MSTGGRRRKFEDTHPWLTFSVDFQRASFAFWVILGECQSKIEHLAGVPLRPETAQKFHQIYLAKGIRATTAIEGNTLSEQEVMKHIQKKLDVPPSREYLKQEVDNILQACNKIMKENLNENVSGCSRDRIVQFNKMALEKLALAEGVVPGEIPTFGVVVGTYLAAPREDCHFLLGRLCEWLNGKDFEAQGELQVGMSIIKAVLAHLYIAWIHPFGDGNGRTARLLELDILLAAGVPVPAAHLLSNHYNLTREEYYRQLDRTSKTREVLPFLLYAVAGLRDGLREQIREIKEQQREVAWINYVHQVFKDHDGAAYSRRKHLVLDLSARTEPVKAADLTSLSGRIANAYAGKGSKTLVRDLNFLREWSLIERKPQGYIANKRVIDAFMPTRRQRSAESVAGEATQSKS